MWWLLLVWLAAVCSGTTLERPPTSGCGRECDSWWAVAARSLQRHFTACRRATGAFHSLDEDLFLSALRVKNCLKEDFLRAFDFSAQEKELPLSPFVTLIREDRLQQLNNTDPRLDAVNEDLIESIQKRFSRLLDTHSFKFNFSQLWSKSSSSIEFEEEREEEEDEEDGENGTPRSWEREGRQRLRRRRQQYRKAFPMMVAGYMMMSAFLVPLGFQFMAMIGGKALLLAKMAFFMSLFSGYKRLTNDIEYHHHPLHDHHHHDFLHHYPSFHHRSSHEAPQLSSQGLLSQMPSAFGQLGQLGGQLGQLGGHFGMSRKG